VGIFRSMVCNTLSARTHTVKPTLKVLEEWAVLSTASASIRAFFSKNSWPLFRVGVALSHVKPNAGLLTTQAAGEVSPPSGSLTGLEAPECLVCAPGQLFPFSNANRRPQEGVSHCPSRACCRSCP
jgi:hypothetical protein